MEQKTVGYFEGANPEWLTILVANGFDTLPISNGYDGHGKDVRLFSAKDKVDAVIGYLHKIVAPQRWETSTDDILHSCVTYDVPVLLAIPSELHDKARGLLGKSADGVTLVEPAAMMDKLLKVLK